MLFFACKIVLLGRRVERPVVFSFVSSSILLSNQIPCGLSRRRKDQIFAEILRERPFHNVVFIV